MNVKNAASVASYAASSGMLIKCPYCGAKTISLSDYCVCSWCEALIHRKMSETNNNALSQAVSSISQNYSSKNYDVAVSACDNAYTSSKSAWFLYLKGIVLLSASNNETSLISYDKPGFMEDNASHRVAASKLYADSRLSLYKAISEAAKGSADSKALDTTFLQFISSVKLKDKTGAKHYLNELSELGDDLASKYAKMLIFNLNGLYEESLSHAESLLTKKSFSVGALYYASLALFKLHKTNDAKALISEAIKYISTPSALALHDDIMSFGKV
ncbi:MAG: hypothetical protein QW814_00520 [Methanothrix sp.]